MRKTVLGCVCLAMMLIAGTGVAARQQAGPLKNDTIVSMVKGRMPESVILSTIQTSDTQFDVSPAAVTELKTAGVSTKVIDAMVAAGARPRGATPPAAAGPGPARAAPAPARPPGQPYVELVQDTARQDISAGTTRLTQADTKNQDLNSLATDGALARSLQNLATDVATRTAVKSGVAAAGPVAGAAASTLGGLMRRKPTVVYVWALPSQDSGTAVATGAPTFEVSFAGIPGVNASEYAPAIVKLVPATNEWRLVGAARGEVGALQSLDADWELYSSFSEEKIPAKLTSLAAGRVQIEPGTPLGPGAYAIVLRPVSKKKKFSGADLTNQRGDGSLFNSIWPFVVGPTAGRGPGPRWSPVSAASAASR
jgi:hypothetical protein